MFNEVKKDFLSSLQKQIDSKLSGSGILGVAVATYEQSGEPVIELSGSEAKLIEAKKVLRSYAPMLVLKAK